MSEVNDMQFNIPSGVVSVCAALAARGHQSFVVGGAPRDLLLGRPVHERTLAGLERARAEGKVLGRPSGLMPEQVAAAGVLRAQGASWAKVGTAVGCKPSTMRAALARIGGANPTHGPVENRPAPTGVHEPDVSGKSPEYHPPHGRPQGRTGG